MKLSFIIKCEKMISIIFRIYFFAENIVFARCPVARKYNKITDENRKAIEKWYNEEGLDPADIASLLDIHIATVYRELDRGKKGFFYSADLAQSKIKRRWKGAGGSSVRPRQEE